MANWPSSGDDNGPNDDEKSDMGIEKSSAMGLYFIGMFALLILVIIINLISGI
jgi:hypothetical protein